MGYYLHPDGVMGPDAEHKWKGWTKGDGYWMCMACTKIYRYARVSHEVGCHRIFWLS